MSCRGNSFPSRRLLANMAGIFQFPLAFATKRKKALDAFEKLPQFTWNQLSSQEVVGKGSFGAVFITDYSTTSQPAETVVVKKLLSTAKEFTDQFIKEAKILNGLAHENIVAFKAVCKEPIAMMLEYVYFDLEIFGGDDKVSSLSDFLSCLDQNDCQGIESKFLTKIASDVLDGLKYLHEKDIAHRDLKPANVLVSNQHYRAETDRNEKYVRIKNRKCRQRHHSIYGTIIYNYPFASSTAPSLPCFPGQSHGATENMQISKPQRPKPPTGIFAFALLSFLDSKVSRCYGCGQSLKPGGLVPQAPNDLVVTTRLHRKYFKDGGHHVSPDVSSIYCHVNLYCVTTAFPGFQPNLCQLPSDLLPFLLPEHKAMAFSKLGVSV
ncbi:hypothetical protein ACROYT_G011569 [Oculina patagonica]